MSWAHAAGAAGRSAARVLRCCAAVPNCSSERAAGHRGAVLKVRLAAAGTPAPQPVLHRALICTSDRSPASGIIEHRGRTHAANNLEIHKQGRIDEPPNWQARRLVKFVRSNRDTAKYLKGLLQVA